MSSEVEIEVFQDMYFINKMFEIQKSLNDVWLRDFYTKMIASYLSIVLHECLQANLLDKEKSNEKTRDLLDNYRNRILKLVPDGKSKTIKEIMDSMGIDFDHYSFDLQVSKNLVGKKELFDINFTHYDMFGDEEMRVFNSLIQLPKEITKFVLTGTKLHEYENDKWYYRIGEQISRCIELKRYPYSSGVFFKETKMLMEDKLLILYYYSFIKQALEIDLLVPERVGHETTALNTIRAKCKFRAVIIESFGQYLMKETTPLAKELRFKINETIKDKVT